MANDAKLGLVVGMGLVIGVAVMFYRKEQGRINPAGTETYASPIQATVPPSAPRGVYRPVRSPTMTQTEDFHLDEPREVTNASSSGPENVSRAESQR
jgi:hypothetical protein